MTASLLVGVLAVPVGAAGPKCVDLLGQSATSPAESVAVYNGTQAGVSIFIADAQCRQATYTFYVLEESGDTTPIAVATAQGPADATPDLIEIITNVTASDDDVCVYVESSIGRHVFDRAPADGSCVLLVNDPGGSPGGGKGF